MTEWAGAFLSKPFTKALRKEKKRTKKKKLRRPGGRNKCSFRTARVKSINIYLFGIL